MFSRLERPLARVPPCFSHHESAWGARPLGCHRGFRILRATGLRVRSGATVFFHAPSALGASDRSGATVFFSPRERLERPSARVPPWFSHPERQVDYKWTTSGVGDVGGGGVVVEPTLCLQCWHMMLAPGVQKPDLQNLIFTSAQAI